MSSWKMMTRDKGWIKPVLVLTLVGWIPLVGQIVLLGYALEWARLTAWGVDAAPKQRGVDYGKVLTTGGKAFLVCLSMGFVLYAVLGLLFPRVWWIDMGTVMGVVGDLLEFGRNHVGSVSLAVVAIGVVVNTCIMAAALRATLYDSFAAGWRVDRLCQMIGRDFGGFAHVVGIALIGGVVQWVYRSLLAIVAAVMAFGGLLGAVSVFGAHGGYYYDGAQAVQQLLSFGAAPLLVLVVLVVAAGFAGSVLATAMNLVTINAMGQWFNRFDVNRWGVSSAPLPDGVPHGAQGASAASTVDWPPRDSAPVSPAGPAAGAGAAAGADADASAASGVVARERVGPDGASAAGPAECAAERAAEHDPVDDTAAASPAEGVSGEAVGRKSDSVPEQPREPIALGPITTDEEGGPVAGVGKEPVEGAPADADEEGPVQQM